MTQSRWVIELRGGGKTFWQMRFWSRIFPDPDPFFRRKQVESNILKRDFFLKTFLIFNFGIVKQKKINYLKFESSWFFFIFIKCPFKKLLPPAKKKGPVSTFPTKPERAFISWFAVRLTALFRRKNY